MPPASDPHSLLDVLSPRLRERARRLPGPDGRGSGPGSDSTRPGGDFVLYWMRVAVRGHENPALDAALEAGRALDRPVFVYHAVSERYPHASDRHHTFILQGARDVAAELRERGVGYAFHLERPGQRGPHLKALARRAALVVTEEMPVPPLRGWTSSLAETVETPLWAVDASCTFPLASVDAGSTDRAYRFRRATAGGREARIAAGWEDVDPVHPPFRPDLPFEPVELEDASIPDLVAACEIDHGVGPVPHGVGGSRAGYARWAAFLETGIAGYAGRRNDPLAPGTSRMSPYLHYGHVSPFRLAREARARGGKGAEKYLDELLVWRELAWAFCWHHRELETLDALPDWAARSLRERDGESRGVLSLERLARGRTGDRLWDAAQRHLLVHGELHNNVRMTWGKAIVGWSPDAATALERTIHLNHRYALDGRDPASYGGILWCYGAFDRPFEPPRGLLGAVRSRSTGRHAARLDLDAYEAFTGRPVVARPPRVGVVGAGIAGLACARTLADHGLEVVVVDKGRGPGGRCSTRRTREDPSLRFDHGAQYFKVRDPRFALRVRGWAGEGVVAPWEGRMVRIAADGSVREVSRGRRWVGVPGMDALPRHLAAELDLRLETRVERVEREDGGTGRWRLRLAGGDRLDGLDAVVVTAPAPQAAELVEAVDPELASRVREPGLLPCWAAMLRAPGGPDWDGAAVEGSPLAWAARDGSKPGREDREGGTTWVLHAGPEWSREHLEADPGAVAAALTEAFRALPGGEALGEPSFVRTHRWRFARAEERGGPSCHVSPDRSLVLAGDAYVAPRVEGAFLSGLAAAGRILGATVEAVVRDGGEDGRPPGRSRRPDPAQTVLL